MNKKKVLLIAANSATSSQTGWPIGFWWAEVTHPYWAFVEAGYEVVGNVDIGPPVNGRQRARISWIVNTISGEEVGKAIQENVIAAGSLNRSWGKVAEIVSAVWNDELSADHCSSKLSPSDDGDCHALAWSVSEPLGDTGTT